MQKKELNGFGLSAMIIGIISIPMSCLGIGGFLGLLATGFAIVGLVKKNSSYGTSITGLVTGLIAIMFSLFFLLFIFLEDSEETTTQNTNPTQENSLSENKTKETIPPSSEFVQEIEENTIDCTVEKCNVKYFKHEFIENQSGEDCVVVYYEFTNNSKEKQTFSYVVDDTAFQNGIELETSFWLVEDAEDNDYLEIKPGVTIIVYSSYVLRDESPIEIEIEQWSAWDDKIYDSMIIEVE